MSASETGLSTEQTVAIQLRDDAARGRYEALKAEIGAIPGVLEVSGASGLPTQITSKGSTRQWEGNDSEQRLALYNTAVSFGYVDLLGIEVVEGRSFGPEFAADEGEGILINETALQALGWTTAVGKTLKLNLSGRGSRVVGVVKDFNYQSFRQPIEPLAIILHTERVSYVLAKLAPTSMMDTIDQMEEVMAAISPDYPFEYQFLDEAFDSMYRADRNLGEIFGFFAGVVLAIACIGLFALAAYLAELRTKEISVRKVLGATARDIVMLLNREFGRLVLIAFVLAAPVSWVAMHWWLSEFAFRVAFGWTTVLLAGGFALLLTWMTVGYHSLKASFANPAVALKRD